MKMEIFIPGIPKNSNARSQWARFASAANRKKFRTATESIARSKLTENPLWSGDAPHYVVTARHIYRVKRRRDPLGLAERLKGIMDGLVDAGLLPDDDEDHLTVILERSLRGEEPGIHLTIEHGGAYADNQTTNPRRTRSTR